MNLATSESMASIMHSFRIEKSTVLKTVKECRLTLWEVLKAKVNLKYLIFI